MISGPIKMKNNTIKTGKDVIDLQIRALEKLKNVGSYIVYEEKEFTPFDIDSLIDLIDNTKYNKRLHKKFIEFVPFYEKGKILPNFLDVFEEWRPYFEV